jgi:hypothetical protein
MQILWTEKKGVVWLFGKGFSVIKAEQTMFFETWMGLGETVIVVISAVQSWRVPEG